MSVSDPRLSALLASVERMAGGEVEHRMEISPAHDELDALAFAVNVMVGELAYGSKLLAQAKEEAERRSAELAEMQDALLAKDRLATLGQLAGGVAHQIRNPLAVILNATAVLDHKLPRERHPDIVAALGMIQEEVRHANNIVTALLDYARVKKPARRSVSLVALIDRVLGGRTIPPCIDVRRTADDGLPIVHIDADQIHDALSNIVLNAVESMPNGGTLTIAIRRHDGEIVIEVHDTGHGIAPSLAAHLFEPLQSTKPMGVGLGLVTARTFVEAHGGRIASLPVENGARFEIRLPLDINADD